MADRMYFFTKVSKSFDLRGTEWDPCCGRPMTVLLSSRSGGGAARPTRHQAHDGTADKSVTQSILP
jgi:hypothetical protein